jgi:subtilisin family serine protease
VPHYYSASRAPIELDEAADEIGVRFGQAEGPAVSRAAYRSAKSAHRAPDGGVRRFGRFMTLRENNASTAPVEAVVNALPARLAKKVTRTMPVFVERQSQLRLVATDQILVGFKPSVSAARQRQLLDGLDLTIVGPSEFDPSRQIVVPTSLRRASRTIDLANRLVEADDIVTFAAPNFLAEIRKSAIDDPLFKQQWHLDNTGQPSGLALQDARALGAWAQVGGGKRSMVIAIIDDGIDLDHPDLVKNLWTNPRRGARDRHGRDFLDDDEWFNPRPKAFAEPFDDTNTNDIHGTPCAGIAAAVGGNRKGVAGMAYNCRLMAVKILTGEDLAPNDRIADAIRYASRHADVLSCSWGVARHPDIESALEYAVTRGRRGRGSVICAATGNDGNPRLDFPSSHASVIAVGACNDRGKRSRYSNYGKGIDLVAPSDDNDSRRQGITTTDVHNRGKGYSTGLYCDDFGGTSAATPLAAGVAALVLSANASLQWDAVREILTSTAVKIDRQKGGYRKGVSSKYGFGRVDADAAVKSALAKKRRRKRAAKKR